MSYSIKNIALAGSGNLAWHLAKALKLQGYNITSIWSRDISHAIALAEQCNSKACVDIIELKKSTDLIIIAVPDGVIETVAKNIGEFEGMVVHTAGSVTIDVMKGLFTHHGVLYPLQTFTKNIAVDFTDVPIFIEASSDEGLKAIETLALKLSVNVYKINSEQRLMLHIAAVFAGNYSNLMYIISNEILNNSSLPNNVLYPLILETAQKAVNGDPLKMQTGPARRKDSTTLKKHTAALASFPEYAELYRRLANLISEKYK